MFINFWCVVRGVRSYLEGVRLLNFDHLVLIDWVCRPIIKIEIHQHIGICSNYQYPMLIITDIRASPENILNIQKSF